MREKGEEIASKGFFRRSMEFHPSEFVEPRVKFYLLNEGYAWVPKEGVSLKIQRRKFREIEYFKLGRLPTHATMFQEVGILPTLVCSYFCGLIST